MNTYILDIANKSFYKYDDAMHIYGSMINIKSDQNMSDCEYLSFIESFLYMCKISLLNDIEKIESVMLSLDRASSIGYFHEMEAVEAMSNINRSIIDDVNYNDKFECFFKKATSIRNSIFKDNYKETFFDVINVCCNNIDYLKSQVKKIGV